MGRVHRGLLSSSMIFTVIIIIIIMKSGLPTKSITPALLQGLQPLVRSYWNLPSSSLKREFYTAELSECETDLYVSA